MGLNSLLWVSRRLASLLLLKVTPNGNANPVNPLNLRSQPCLRDRVRLIDRGSGDVIVSAGFLNFLHEHIESR